MNYISTLDLFHISKSKGEFQEALEKKKASELYQEFDFSIHGHKAFYCPDYQIFNLIIDLNKKIEQLNSLFSLLPHLAKKQYIRNSLVIDIKSTNDIEGVHPTKKDIAMLIEDAKANSSNRRIVSIVNKYVSLLDPNQKISLNSTKDISSIYHVLLKEAIDKTDQPDGLLFRKGEVNITDGIKIDHSGITPESEIDRILSIGLNILKSEQIDSLAKNALFHFIFEYVHPFYDGNGRTGRFISTYLFKKDFASPFAFRLSSTINKAKSKYYKAFEKAEDPNNYADLSTYVYEYLSILRPALSKETESLQKMKETMESLIKKEEESSSFSSSEKKIMIALIKGSIFSDFGINISQIAEETKCSRSTIMRLLSYLKKDSRIQKTDFKPYLYKLTLNN